MATNHGKPRLRIDKITPSPTTGKATVTTKAISVAERQHMIREAAYFIAQKRGFSPGQQNADWAKAELQVDAQIERLRGRAPNAQA